MATIARKYMMSSIEYQLRQPLTSMEKYKRKLRTIQHGVSERRPLSAIQQITDINEIFDVLIGVS